MIGKLPDIKGSKEREHEYAAQEIHILTSIKLDSCLRIVCEIDDMHTIDTLIAALRNEVTAQQLLTVYEHLSEIEMLMPRRSKP